MDNNSKSRIRKRGIKASRVKLEEAQSLAGYRTQASLAEAIANRENLDSAPKDIVSKIFREIPVSHSSIQRVAGVLGVEAYTLYKSAEEEKPEKIPEAQIPEPMEKTPTPKSTFYIRGTLLFFLLGVIGVATAIFETNDLAIKVENQTNRNHAGKFANKKPILGTFSLVVDTDERSSKLLHLSSLLKKLEENHTLSDYSQFNATSSKDVTPSNILHELQADFFLKIEATEVGAFTNITASLYTDNEGQDVWSTSIRRSYIELDVMLFLEDLVSTIEFETGLREAYTSKFSESTNKLAILNYMKGRELLDESQDVSNFKKAQDFFLSAVNSSPKFASAYAGICKALVDESWGGNEKSLLEQAQTACDKAMDIASYHPYINAVNFYLLRRTGRVEDALKLHGSIDDSWNKGVDYVHALAETNFDAYRQNPDNKEYITEAKKLVKKAILIDPSFWQSYNTLGLIEFSVGNTQAAIDAMAIAVKYNPNELSYVNLGTLSFCQSNEKDALHYFTESLKLSTDYYLANEMIGLVHYYHQNYQASFEYRKKALDSLSDYGVHNRYGAIAESAEKLKMYDEAKEYYQQALRIIERDTLRGNLTPTDEAIGLYYNVKLRLLNGERLRFNSDPLKPRIETLTGSSANLESAAIIRLALIHAYFEEFDQAQALLTSAAKRCPTYINLPDLAFLFERDNAS
jgi:tetratricopeptide (TPR) repeat protein